MSGRETSSSDEKISYNSKSVLLGLFALIGFILLIFYIVIFFLDTEDLAHLNPIFIGAISGTFALGGTLVSQLWGKKTDNKEINRPSVSYTRPFDSQTKVPVDTDIIASFNKLMDKETITPAAFTLTDAKDSKVSVEGKVELIGGDAKFTPNKPLNANSKYTAKISKDVKDLGGNPLTIDKTWSFTTA
jgi:hypothetical protein